MIKLDKINHKKVKPAIILEMSWLLIIIGSLSYQMVEKAACEPQLQSNECKADVFSGF